jgi:hypothetical protein
MLQVLRSKQLCRPWRLVCERGRRSLAQALLSVLYDFHAVVEEYEARSDAIAAGEAEASANTTGKAAGAGGSARGASLGEARSLSLKNPTCVGR